MLNLTTAIQARHDCYNCLRSLQELFDGQRPRNGLKARSFQFPRYIFLEGNLPGKCLDPHLAAQTCAAGMSWYINDQSLVSSVLRKQIPNTSISVGQEFLLEMLGGPMGGIIAVSYEARATWIYLICLLIDSLHLDLHLLLPTVLIVVCFVIAIPFY